MRGTKYVLIRKSHKTDVISACCDYSTIMLTELNVTPCNLLPDYLALQNLFACPHSVILLQAPPFLVCALSIPLSETEHVRLYRHALLVYHTNAYVRQSLSLYYVFNTMLYYFKKDNGQVQL